MCIPKVKFAKNAWEVEGKFSFHAAKDVLDLWTGILADRGQNMASMAYNWQFFLQKLARLENVHPPTHGSLI